MHNFERSEYSARVTFVSRALNVVLQNNLGGGQGEADRPGGQTCPTDGGFAGSVILRDLRFLLRGTEEKSEHKHQYQDGRSGPN